MAKRRNHGIRTKVKDHSGRTSSANQLPSVPDLDLCLYHWSPSRNRDSIKRYGLLPRRLTLQGNWRPPYVAFADDPMLAWTLSGRLYPGINSWDLWMCYTPSQTSFEHWEIILDTFPDTGRHYVKEYRIYSRVWKRDLKYVATREQ